METIEVLVNQTPIPQVDPGTRAALWSYDASANAVVFTPGATPDTGAIIDVRYTGC